LSDELLVVEQGSLYPAVYRIEQRGAESYDVLKLIVRQGIM